MNQSALLETEFISDDEYKKVAEISHTEKNIKSIISLFEDRYTLNYSDEIFSDPNFSSKTENYQKSALEIKDAIEVYETLNKLPFNFNNEKLNNEVCNEVKEMSQRILSLVSLNEEYIKSDKKGDLSLVVDNSIKIRTKELQIDNITSGIKRHLKKIG